MKIANWKTNMKDRMFAFQKRERFPARKERGFTLLEAMIALFILTVGLLGLAGMQTMAMITSVDAGELTLATNMGTEMIERIQFNSQNGVSYNGIDTTQVGAILACPNALAGIQDIALGDCLQWQAMLNASRLTNPRGVVVANPAGPAGLNQTQVTITVNWQTKGTDNKQSRLARVNLGTIVTPP